VTFSNDASVEYTYDAAGRTTRIEHLDDGSAVILQLDYTYTVNDLPVTITESASTGVTALVEFEYDARNRLIHECRTTGDECAEADPEDIVYYLTYEYDDGGNRTEMVDAVNELEIEIEYEYDINDVYDPSTNPGGYMSNNNRLAYYETWDTSGKSEVLVSTTWYDYNNAGNVTSVVTNVDGTDDYSAVRFVYAKNAQEVTFVLGEVWEWDGKSSCEVTDSYEVTFAREFRNDSGRQRYLVRNYDVAYLNQATPQLEIESEVWSDYDGENIYGDFTAEAGNPDPIITDLRSFEPGVARVLQSEVTSGDGYTEYYHSDMIGTTRTMSDDMGDSFDDVVYTAFGQPVCAIAGGSCTGVANPRYGYAGAWGYQAHDDFPFLHVGARYYDPATGRFLQRDPIGIHGGVNVYAYAGHTPTRLIDPTGLDDVDMGVYDNDWFQNNGMGIYWESTFQTLEDMRAERDRALEIARTARYGLAVCTLFTPVHKLIKLGFITGLYIYESL
jgi:RHS repeat-associated protein